MPTYLLLEDGGKITLEDASGFILLEIQDPDTVSTDTHDLGWRDYTPQKRRFKQNFDRDDRKGLREILEKAAGLVEDKPERKAAVAIAVERVQETLNTEDLAATAKRVMELARLVSFARQEYALLKELARKMREADEEQALMVILREIM